MTLTTTYHHLLVVVDWEIAANQLFFIYQEIEPALRKVVKDAAERWNFDEAVLEEVAAAKDLDDLREVLESHDVAVYIQTIDAPKWKDEK